MSEGGSNAVVVTRQGGVHIVEFVVTNLVDQAEIDKIGRTMEELVESAGHPKIVVNFANLNHVSSAMLGVLISMDKKIRAMKGEMRLAGIPASIMQVFKLTRLDKLLKIFDTVDQAVLRF
jgi:anti-sigma B factor antagonist